MVMVYVQNSDDDDDDEYDDDDDSEETALESYETILESVSCDVDEYMVFKEVLSGE